MRLISTAYLVFNRRFVINQRICTPRKMERFKCTRCINCLHNNERLSKINLRELDDAERTLLMTWVGDENIEYTDDYIICRLCYIHLKKSIATGQLEKKCGYPNVCVVCGSTLSKHFRQFKNTPVETIIADWIPLQMKNNARVCMKCWFRAHYHLRQNAQRNLVSKNPPDPLEVPQPPLDPDLLLSRQPLQQLHPVQHQVDDLQMDPPLLPIEEQDSLMEEDLPDQEPALQNPDSPQPLDPMQEVENPPVQLQEEQYPPVQLQDGLNPPAQFQDVRNAPVQVQEVPNPPAQLQEVENPPVQMQEEQYPPVQLQDGLNPPAQFQDVRNAPVQVQEVPNPPAQLQEVENPPVQLHRGPPLHMPDQAQVDPEMHHGEQHLQREPEFVLPNYKRAAATERVCMFPRCQNQQRQVVPLLIKIHLLQELNFFVPHRARICNLHLHDENWALLTENDNAINSFTALQIEELINMLQAALKKPVNFNNIDEMSPELTHFWFGFSIQKINEILLEVPSLHDRVKIPKKVLSMYLLKLRTGDSNSRIASLFGVSEKTVRNSLQIVRDCLMQDFVPLYIGFNHMTIEEVAQKNTTIPNGLFGEVVNPPDNRPAIVISDGTYIYVQKSKNYLFQKETYSPHKSTNLIKAFMMVCCDGTILDILGPYKAIDSDAKIMSELFADPNGEGRRFFRENDIFILDRGFRDAIPQLRQYNYAAFMPESVDPGENQLSTIQANRSRWVTMCRWVVEVVNGRFKRDFKIFRGTYNNKSLKNAMTDFSIAGAFLNKFHPLIEDRPDALRFLNLALEKVDVPNYLGDFIIAHNINRRRVNFEIIDGNVPELPHFPRLQAYDLEVLALGTYQIKQARSYYGEHIRQDGMYRLEVCPDLEQLHMQENLRGLDSCLLRTKIKSRHSSLKSYYTYILIDKAPEIPNSLRCIAGYYCSCKVGKRTVGCCCHVMTVVWYLGWARHQPFIEPPARILDELLILLRGEEDEE